MMESKVSRRSLLRGAGILTLAAGLGPLFAPIAHAAASADLQVLRQRWVDQVTGRTVITAGDPDFVSAINALDKAVITSRGLLAQGANRTQVFTDASLAADAQIVTTYKRLAQMATAWATPGSAHEASTVVLAEILAGLEDGYRLIYNENQPEFGNWWSWEIGTPKALTDTMAIVADHLSDEQIAKHCAAIDHYIPDPTKQFPDSRGKILSEGANRVDICQAIIIRSIVGGDVQKLQAAIDALTPTWQYVARGNGFFKDGSFIQHSTIGYTGTYGVVLLGGLARLFSLLGPTGHAVSDPSRSILFSTVEASFAPFIHDGLMIDSVRGRAISRSQERGFDDGTIAIEAILWLARAVDVATAARWRSMCLGWIQRNTVTKPLKGASIPRTALFKELLATTSTALAESQGHSYFPAMDRSVYRGNGWAFALGLSSRRTTWYECGNGENNTGCHTGSGMSYLFAADAGHWDNDFWATANPNRLPGTTVDTTPLPPKVQGEWGASTPQNEWTGGTGRDGYGVVGQHLIGPGGTGLSARKSWFFTPEAVVALGSDIHTKSGARVETVVEHRNLGAAAVPAIAFDGVPVQSAPLLHTEPAWAHVEGIGGYLFLGSEAVTVQRENRSGSWRDVNQGGSTTVISRSYATMHIDHGTQPDGASYAYALLPGKSAAETESAARSSRPTILRNDTAAQSVRLGKLTATNFWQACAVDNISAAGPACVLWWASSGTAKVAVSDPLQTADAVTLTVTGTRFTRVRSEAKVQLIRAQDGTLTLIVPTTGLAGGTVPFQLGPSRAVATTTAAGAFGGIPAWRTDRRRRSSSCSCSAKQWRQRSR